MYTTARIRCNPCILWRLPGFTTRYGVKTLVYAEPHDDIEAAITREKRIKRWRRAYKVALIESHNPNWRDLSADLNK